MRFFVLILCLFFAHPAHSKLYDSDAAQEHAQNIIDACWAISKKDRESGVTSRMMKGSYETTNCLQKEIKRLSKKNFNEENDHKDFINELNTYVENAYSINWLLYNGSCSQIPCPTMFHPMHISATAHNLQSILKTMLTQAKYHEKTLQ